MAEKKQKTADEAPALGISSLAPHPRSRKRRKRVGCGEGSGHGKTCCKGGKGQTMRAGGRIPRGFEGGQMPLHRRLPKVGFTSRKKTLALNVYQLVDLERLAAFDDVSEFSLAALREHGLVRSDRKKVKLLGKAQLKRKLTVEAHAFSASARAAIEQSGGVAKIIA